MPISFFCGNSILQNQICHFEVFREIPTALISTSRRDFSSKTRRNDKFLDFLVSSGRGRRGG